MESTEERARRTSGKGNKSQDCTGKIVYSRCNFCKADGRFGGSVGWVGQVIRKDAERFLAC